MSDGGEDELIATWPRRSNLFWSGVDRVAGTVLVGLFVAGWPVAVAVFAGATLAADWGSALVAAWFVGGLTWMIVASVRSLAARVELRRSGLVVRTFRNERRISWPEVVRTEVEQDIDFPTTRRRGPMLIVHLVGGSSVRLWATETWTWGADRRMDELNRRARMIRQAHRAFDERARTPRRSG